MPKFPCVLDVSGQTAVDDAERDSVIDAALRPEVPALEAGKVVDVEGFADRTVIKFLWICVHGHLRSAKTGKHPFRGALLVPY